MASSRNIPDMYVYEIKNSFEKTLFLLVEKIYNSNKSCIIYSGLQDRIESYDQMLWTFKKISFIPHMIVGEEFYEKNKILLSSEFNNNFANFDNVILLDNYGLHKKIPTKGRIIFLVHGKDTIANELLLKELEGYKFKHFREKKDSTWEVIAN